MAPTNRAALLREKGAPLTVSEAPYPVLEPNQVIIRNHAAAFNPADTYVVNMGIFINSWPFVPGMDCAGIVEEVGEGVTHVKPGDHVYAVCTADWTATGFKDSDGFGAFQLYTRARTNRLGKLPDNVSFADGAVFPITLWTSAIALFIKQHLNLEKPSFSPSKKDEYVLIWGGSSSVGMCAIQLAAMAGYKVITTCSQHNQAVCEEIGAEKVFDHKSSSIEDDIVAYLTGKSLIGSLDAISRYGTTDQIVKVVQRAAGTKRIAFVVPGTEQGHPDDIKASSVAGEPDEEAKSFIQYLFQEFLPAALEKGLFKAGRPEPEIVGEGLEFADEALKRMADGVSAKKLVILL